MKQIWTAACLVTLAFACKNEKANNTTTGQLPSGTLTITGEVAGTETGILEVLTPGETAQKADTIRIENGKFSYTSQLQEPVQMVIRMPGQRGEELVFFADPGEINITTNRDSLWTGTVKAGKTQELYKQAEDSIRHIMAKGKALYNSYMEAQQKQDGVSMQRLEQEYMGIQQQAEQFAFNFCRRNNASVIAPYLGMMYFSEDGKQPQLKQLYDTLTVAVKGSFFGKKVAAIVKAAEGTAVGAQATNFTLPDVNGKPVSLDSYKGKYVLVDFWASWCGPCRQENPNVVKAYNAYKAKGFDILGVSLDKNKEDWTKAIADDNLTWTHVSDLKYWENAAARLYGVQAIPANFLLDKEGKIIGKNLRGEELEGRLREVMP